MTPIITVIEDDKDVSEFIESILTDEGFRVRVAHKGIAGISLVDEQDPDLVLLDLSLPDMQGESVCVELKKNHPELPIIMLTAKTSLSDKVQGFNSGADDYITKPFAAEELIARIKARLRTTSDTGVLKVADLEMDTKKVTVKRGSKEIDLTPQEFKLLEYLMQNAGTVLSREQILNKIWSYSYEVQSRVVDVYMGYLRKKIDTSETTKLIQSVRGFGYTIKE